MLRFSQVTVSYTRAWKLCVWTPLSREKHSSADCSSSSPSQLQLYNNRTDLQVLSPPPVRPLHPSVVKTFLSDDFSPSPGQNGGLMRAAVTVETLEIRESKCWGWSWSSFLILILSLNIVLVIYRHC